MTMTTIMIIITTTNTRWLKKSGRTPTSALTRRILTGASAVKMSPPDRSCVGLTGGLIPCPASITVLLICLQLKHFALGATLVFSFSIGLALTLVASGAIAALSLKHATKRWPGFSEFSRKAPWISAALITVVGIYMSLHGLSGILA
jgi:ABC-type nickel/cobalt efflux system permease component RcnA